MAEEIERRRVEMVTKCDNEGWNHPWAEWDEAAGMMNEITYDIGTEVEDEMKLDEEIHSWYWDKFPDQKPIDGLDNMRWTEEFMPQYPANYEFPENPSYDNPLFMVVDSGGDLRWDFKFADGQHTGQVVTFKDGAVINPENLADGISFIEIWQCGFMQDNIIGVDFYDIEGELL